MTYDSMNQSLSTVRAHLLDRGQGASCLCLLPYKPPPRCAIYIKYRLIARGGTMQEYVPPTPPAFDDDKVRRTLENLIDACFDGEAGFRDAAEHVKDPQLRQYFADRGRERARFSVELRRELERDGHWQSTREGSVTGALYRTWFDIKRAVGGGDQAVLDSVEAGEDAARDAY